ncbi:wall-associated receptor kinase 2-like [Papaver somniferum]|uniref:wall-associated receptor kinase 2-like n=1 Tax=Papaver somniferum TaxID=3469 RepID=UPI000E6FD2E0|nr:wall-associated receptor kinase 2-like [Papaver somniferum]
MVFCSTITLSETGVAATREVRAISTATRWVSVNGTGISSNKIVLPGCKDRCGNIIASISSYGAFYEVSVVTLDYVRINRPVIALCDYDRVNYTTRLEELVYLWTELLDFSESGTSFTISNTLNKLIILGCNIYGSISPADDSSRNGNQKIDVTSSGCASHCTNGYIGIPSPCVGNGCCKATIPNPNGLAGFKIQVERIVGRQTDSVVPYTEPCLRVFVADQDFTGDDDLILSRNYSPFASVIMEWVINDFDTCNKTDSRYACGINTDCLESHIGRGYRCKCSKGYRGNPYLQHGCQDVDECKEESHKCGSGFLCTNTPGSYNCDCAPGEKLGISSLGYHCMPDKRKLQVAALVASGVVVSVC